MAPEQFVSAADARADIDAFISTLTLAVVTGLSVEDVSRNAVANLGWEHVRLPAPLFAGDNDLRRIQVLEVRPSASRPGQGIVRVHTRGFNQDDVTIMEFERVVLVYSRSHRPGA